MGSDRGGRPGLPRELTIFPPRPARFNTLAEGESLEFDVTRGPKGLQAGNVRKA